MNNINRHYRRKAVRQSMNIKENFFILWKLVRLDDILRHLKSSLVGQLNQCGWLFRRSERNYLIYRAYKNAEEFSRLISWVNNDIRLTDNVRKERLTPDQRHYIINLLVELKMVMDDCMKYSPLNQSELEMLGQMTLCYIKKLINNI